MKENIGVAIQYPALATCTVPMQHPKFKHKYKVEPILEML